MYGKEQEETTFLWLKSKIGRMVVTVDGTVAVVVLADIDERGVERVVFV